MNQIYLFGDGYIGQRKFLSGMLSVRLGVYVTVNFVVADIDYL